jgi:hypothetical protein
VRGAAAASCAGRHQVVVDEKAERKQGRMSARGHVLHVLPNNSGLHSISLNKVYAGCQSPFRSSPRVPNIFLLKHEVLLFLKKYWKE